jgi:hypothetical protein
LTGGRDVAHDANHRYTGFDELSRYALVERRRASEDFPDEGAIHDGHTRSIA